MAQKRVPLILSLSLGAIAADAATIVVPAGGSLQNALNAARPGDVITLAPGATYVGNFVLPNKGAIADSITIRSAAPDASLPQAGVRMTPAYAAQLPKIKSPNSVSAHCEPQRPPNHWTLMFLEFQANQNGYGDIVSLGAGDSTQTQLSQVPYALVLDRVYVHGDPVLGQKRGIGLNSSDTTIDQSYVSDCKAVGQDTQALGGYNGPGNYLIENNYLEGATENVLFGGADPPIPEPRDDEHHLPPQLPAEAAGLARSDHRDAGGVAATTSRRRLAAGRNLLLQGSARGGRRAEEQSQLDGVRRSLRDDRGGDDAEGSRSRGRRSSALKTTRLRPHQR